MNLFRWRQFVLPVALPLTISLGIALAGPVAPFGSSPQPAGEPVPGDAPLLRHIPPDDGDATPTIELTPVVVATPAPAPTDSPPASGPAQATPPPAPAAQAPEPRAAQPSVTPAPTPSVTPAPTPTPVPVIGAPEACSRAEVYAQTQMPSVTVEVKACAASHAAGVWDVAMRIRHPGCAPLEAQGLPCANSPLKLRFFVYDADLSVAAADDYTALILATY